MCVSHQRRPLAHHKQTSEVISVPFSDTLASARAGDRALRWRRAADLVDRPYQVDSWTSQMLYLFAAFRALRGILISNLLLSLPPSLPLISRIFDPSLSLLFSVSLSHSPLCLRSVNLLMALVLCPVKCSGLMALQMLPLTLAWVDEMNSHCSWNKTRVEVSTV